MRKIVPIAAAGVTALAVAAGTFAYGVSGKDVTLSVDGVARTVETRAGTVADVLAAEGVVVGRRDVVAPAADAAITDGTLIAVQYARPLTVTVDGTPKTYWTTATDVGQALTSLAISTDDAELSTSRSAGISRQGLTVALDTQKSITVKVDGKKRSLTTTATTVGEALAEAKVEVDGNDRTSLDLDTRLTDGVSVTVVDVAVSSIKRKESVAYRTVRKSSSSLTKGTTRVQTAGRAGSRTVTYRVVREDGEVVKKTAVSSKVTRKAVTRVLLVGTKKVAAPTVNNAPGNTVWDRLAKCESGGNWAINTGNGFYGGLQFTLSTWRGYGGSGMPHRASRAAQIAVAKKVQAGQGWGAWPACSAKLGLR